MAPFSIMNLRDINRSYIIITRQNNPDEHNPWANMIISLPQYAVNWQENSPPITNPIWATDEYAIRAFISYCRMHSSLTKNDPISPILISQ